MNTASNELVDSSAAVRWYRGRLHETESDDESHDYDSLRSYLELASFSKREVVLRFEKIEALIERPLPGAAFRDRFWWSNVASVGRLKHTGAWLNAGYVVTAVQSDRATGWVRFRREIDVGDSYRINILAVEDESWAPRPEYPFLESRGDFG